MKRRQASWAMRLGVLGGSIALVVVGYLVIGYVLPSPHLCLSISCGKDFTTGAAPLFGGWFPWSQVAVILSAGLLSLTGTAWALWPRR